MQLGCGEDGAVSGGRGGGDRRQRRRRRGRPREAHAAAHIRIVPVDAPSKADQPPELRLVPCGLPQMSVAALLGSGSGSGSGGLLGLGGTEPAHVLRGVSGARGSADEFPDTQSERKSGSRGPKGAKHAVLREGASTGTGPGSRVGRKGQRARPMRASANTSTPWRHSHVPLDPARAHSKWTAQDQPVFSLAKLVRNQIDDHHNSYYVKRGSRNRIAPIGPCSAPLSPGRLNGAALSRFRSSRPPP
jgi:hypothetical protein